MTSGRRSQLDSMNIQNMRLVRRSKDALPRAVKDIEKISPRMQTKIIKGIEMLGDDLAGDVKRLTNFTPECRLRIGDYRVLFEDLRCLREAKAGEKDAPTIGLEELKKKFQGERTTILSGVEQAR